MKKGLKITLWIVLALFILLVIAPPYINKTFFPDTYVDKDKLKTLMSNEVKVKDYVLTEEGVLYISVLDDGTDRDGLAEYFCQEMKSNKIPIERVKVVKYGSQNSSERDNAYGILLGEAWCN